MFCELKKKNVMWYFGGLRLYIASLTTWTNIIKVVQIEESSKNPTVPSISNEFPIPSRLGYILILNEND